MSQHLFLNPLLTHCQVFGAVAFAESRADNPTLRAASVGGSRLPDCMRRTRWSSTDGPTVVTIATFPRGLESVQLQENRRTA